MISICVDYFEKRHRVYVNTMHKAVIILLYKSLLDK